MSRKPSQDPELKAMQDVINAIEDLEMGSKLRVLGWATSRAQTATILPQATTVRPVTGGAGFGVSRDSLRHEDLPPIVTPENVPEAMRLEGGVYPDVE